MNAPSAPGGAVAASTPSQSAASPPSTSRRRGLPRVALGLCAFALVGLVGAAARLLARGDRTAETVLLLACAALLCLMAFGLGRTRLGGGSRSPERSGASEDVHGVLDALPEALIVFDPSGRPTVCNAIAEQLLGGAIERIAKEGLIPAGWRVVRNDGTPLSNDQHPVSVARRTGIAQHSETLGLYRPDDTVVWLSVSAVPLPQAGTAESRGVVCTFSDITRQRQRDRALVAREAQILRALELAPFALWSVDSRGRLSFFAGTAGSGRERWADLTGKPATELLQGVPGFAEELRRALSGESFTALNEKEGRFYETRFYPSRDPGGRIDGASGISIDVTPRVAAEAEQAKLRDALRGAAEEWRATFDAIDTPLLVLAADNTVRRVNRATQILWDEPFESIIGSRLPDEAPGLPWAAMLRAAAQCRAAGGAVTLQEHDDAGDRYWDVTASAMAAVAGAPQPVIVLARDVSQVVELRQSLRRSERMSVMGELVSGVAHQVRNPLFAICATLDACEAEHGPHSELHEVAQALRTESSRLSRLMNHLLDFGKAGKIRREPGSLADVVASAVVGCRSAAKEAGVTVTANVPADLPVLALDEGRMQEALCNVIENAIQHSTRGAQVRAAVRREDGYGTSTIVCEVDDDGPGFRPGDERHLFEPFFSRRSGGTGLGMSIAQRIVHEHGGRISAGNRPGGGARVTIALPCTGAAQSDGEPNG